MFFFLFDTANKPEGQRACRQGQMPPKKEAKTSTPAAVPAPDPAPGGVGRAEVLSWVVEYAKSGRSKCQITAEVIEQGKLRIGKEIDNPHKAGTTMTVWHTVAPLFDSFKKGATDKARITNVAELKGFDDLTPEDKEMLEDLVSKEQAKVAELNAADASATRLEHTKDGGVFWQISLKGSMTRTKWGPLGTPGSVTEKTHADEAAAEKYMNKMIGDKLKGGYARAGGDAPAASAAAASAAAAPAPAKSSNAADKRKTAQEAVPPAKKAKKGTADAADTAAAPAPDPAQAEAPVTAPAKPGPPPGSCVGDGTRVHSWSVEYAKSGRSKCQITAEVIEQGKLRIGKEIDNPHKAGTTMTVWHTVAPLFDSFKKGATDKARITNVAELKGFDDLTPEDKEMLEDLVSKEQAKVAELNAADASATRLEHTKDGGVFWQISLKGSMTRTKWGPLGTPGSVTEKTHADEAAAEKYMNKMIGDKLKGGYARAGGDAPAASAAAAPAQGKKGGKK